MATPRKKQLCLKVRDNPNSVTEMGLYRVPGGIDDTAIPSRDTDGDGKISLEEFKTWLIPENFDLFNVEAQHLIHYADSDLVCSDPVTL